MTRPRTAGGGDTPPPGDSPPPKGTPPKIVRPFARQGFYTVVDNAVLDALLPRLSGNEAKVLLVAIRQTTGYHREAAAIPFDEIMTATGIGSRTTVAKALSRLTEDVGVLVSARDSRRRPASYALNVDFELDVAGYRRAADGDVPEDSDEEGDADADSGSSSPENGLLSSPENGPLYKQSVLNILSLLFQSNGGGDAPPTSLSGFRLWAERTAEDLRRDRAIAFLRALTSALYGIPDGDAALPDFARIGAWTKQAGPARVARMLFRYAAEDVTGNPLRYIAAAESARRQMRQAARSAAERGALSDEDAAAFERADAGMPSEAVHLTKYRRAVVAYLVERGADAARFHAAGTDAYKERVWIYVDPALQS